MIYTVTFNPSLDYVIQVDDLTLGEVNRTTSEKIYPGGKGNNVSVILSNLGHKSKALGFKAGFTGEQMETMLEEFGCYTDFIPLEEGLTRINVKVKSNEESEINGQGPVITDTAIEALYQKLDKLTAGDVLVLAGSIPNTLPGDMYERIMERLQGKEIRIAVDATKDLLVNVLKYHPFLISRIIMNWVRSSARYWKVKQISWSMQKNFRRWEQSMFSYRWQGTVRSW